MGKRNIHEEKTPRDYHNRARNATGGPRILFQVVQVVSTDGLSQFLQKKKIQRVWRRRRHFETTNQSGIGNYFRLNFFWQQILLFRYAYAYVVRFTFAITLVKHKHKQKKKFPFSYAYASAYVTTVHTTLSYAYAYVTSVNQPKVLCCHWVSYVSYTVIVTMCKEIIRLQLTFSCFCNCTWLENVSNRHSDWIQLILAVSNNLACSRRSDSGARAKNKASERAGKKRGVPGVQIVECERKIKRAKEREKNEVFQAFR